MHKTLLLTGAMLFAFALFIIPAHVRASTSGVYISEVAWAGSSASNADEWIELTNAGVAAADISGWQLMGAASAGETLILPDASVIAAGGTYLIANYGAAHTSSVLAVTPDLVTTKISLSNSQLGITLNDATGSKMDETGDGGNPPAGHTGNTADGIPFASMQRTDPLADGTRDASWTDAQTGSGFDEGKTELGTPRHAEEAVAASEQIDEEESVAEVLDESVDVPVIVPPGTLVINEIYSSPDTGEAEWVEIFNPYNNVIFLSGWSLEEGSGKRTSLPNQPLGLEQFVLIENPSGKLNNSSDTLRLLDPSGAIIDAMSYGSTLIPAPKKRESMARDADGVFKSTTQPTPKGPNVFPSPPEAETENHQMTTSETQTVVGELRTQLEHTSTPVTPPPSPAKRPVFQLAFSEVLPNAGGSDAQEEFVELINMGSEPLDLRGWSMRDASGRTFTQTQTLLINPGARLALYREATRLTLNNEADALVLLDPDGFERDALSYERALPGQSFARLNGVFVWSITATPGQANILTIPADAKPAQTDEAPSTKIAATQSKSRSLVVRSDVSTLPDGAHTATRGVVSAVPGELGSQIFYITQKTGGIQVYKYDADFPDLTQGDVVSVAGTMSRSRGERRIKIGKEDELRIVGRQELTPQEVSIERMSEQPIGTLARTQGWISVLGGKHFLEKNGQAILIKIPASTALDPSLFEIGDEVEITGIVRTDGTTVFLSPRSDTDVRLLARAAERLSTTTATLTNGKDLHLASTQKTGMLLTAFALLLVAFFATRTLIQKRHAYAHSNIRAAP